MMKGLFPENGIRGKLEKIGGEIHFSEVDIFMFLLCTFHTKHIERSGFNPLYLENEFQFC